jgi:UDP-2,3-diacylglucosamine pyrophosphatase LpxH
MATLIVSDIHLGSRNSRAELLCGLLETEFDRVILNGDTVNSLNLKKFRAAHWKLLGQLRSIARRRELVLIRGNHDGASTDSFGSLDVLAVLLGVQMHEEFRLETARRTYLVLHGDRFDPTLNWPILSDAAEWCYQGMQKLSKKAAKWLKHKVKKLGGVVEFVKRQSVRYARSQGCQGIIAGHTHFADDEWIEGIHYLNTGSWVDHPCTYVIVNGEDAELCLWDDGTLKPRREKEALPGVTRLTAS